MHKNLSLFHTPDEGGSLPIDETLSDEEKFASVVPRLKSTSLISLGQLCDDDCEIWLQKHKIYALKNDKIILEGNCNYLNGLWDFDIPVKEPDVKNFPSINKTTIHSNASNSHIHPGLYSRKQSCSSVIQPPSQTKQCTSSKVFFKPSHDLINDFEFDQALKTQQKSDNQSYCYVQPFQEEELNVIICQKQAKEELATFLHTACLAPVETTFIKAIKNNHFITFPGLDENLITKNLPKSVDYALGHINQE